MYTIKILQRLIDRGTHNSIFAFVLLILKNHFQRAFFSAENSSRPRPRPSLATRPSNQASRLPPPIFTPTLRLGLQSERKLPETRLSKNTAPELCGRTFFN